MLTTETETVLISTEPIPTGHERIVMAFREGNDIYIPLDSERPANRDLLDATQIYVRRIDARDEYSIYRVESHQPIATVDRERLEALVHQPISDETEVLHLTGEHVSVAQLHQEATGFVAVIDGSQRALRALAPAREIADWYGRTLTICAVTGGDDDRDTRSAIELQLAGTPNDIRDVVFVAKSDLEARLFEWMRQGQIMVASAFGVWAADGRLHGMVTGLVRHNAPAIIGIGPNVPADWKPSTEQPLTVFVDATDHAHDVVSRIDPFLTPPRGPLTVVHVTTENPPNLDIAAEIAHELHQRSGLPVEARNVAGRSVADAISTICSTLNSQMAVVTSWHRPQSHQPTVASTSVRSIAQAECPVVVLTSASEVA